ncbi:hypothetical protein BJ138DRAFT_387254 [Hygrophoropsis aurantiaca]|uniref:Uncharacterized protein n=1 Tax=Hygrophoropsis aurantiaca TaxID=72124 RepID=A0ACB8AP41_9AGAM|nr:hypothetical protein BJ138DRAFT_387254 [Hygrophoropsis aurantiaca]
MASIACTLPVTLAQAIAYLTRPLILTHPAATIIRLQLVLEANLTALFAPSWVPKEPLRGSGRRCLTLSPACLPPRAVYAACLAAGVQWFDWIAALGGREFDFFVDPGCISIRFGKGAKLVTIWSEELIMGQYPLNENKVNHHAMAQSKTLAQQLLENDEEDEELFAMIADEVNAPTWMTPILDKFPVPARSESPLSAISTDSYSSSRSSNSGSCFSFASTAKTNDSYGSASTVSSTGDKNSAKLSRREKARQARVFIDTSKIEVTPYDGGKTTVLTGGVMLGAGPSKTKNVAPTSFVPTWRRI